MLLTSTNLTGCHMPIIEFLNHIFSSGVTFATESKLLVAKLRLKELNGVEVDWEKDYSNYISKGEFGILAFNDVGRVWLEGEDSNQWHHGYGGGIWVSPFSIAVLSASYERSEDEPGGLFTLRFKFLF